jgi:hypothetical protein
MLQKYLLLFLYGSPVVYLADNGLGPSLSAILFFSCIRNFFDEEKKSRNVIITWDFSTFYIQQLSAIECATIRASYGVQILLQAHSTLAESFFFTNTLEFTGLCF